MDPSRKQVILLFIPSNYTLEDFLRPGLITLGLSMLEISVHREGTLLSGDTTKGLLNYKLQLLSEI